MRFKNSILCLFIISATCFAQKNNVATNSYWTQGKAEVNVYELSQNRYKENHAGSVISIFVTEDFLIEKQVKNETYTNKNSTWILKNIQLKKFTTGVYDYSLFSSVFTPINRKEFPKSLKLTATSQEWCGTIFTQFNLIFNTDYKAEHRSYFEKEGDFDKRIKRSRLEDEIYNVIRMNPKFLPVGIIQMIPSANYLQLKHINIQSYEAKASLKKYEGDQFYGKDLKVYQLEFRTLKRKLQVVFEDKTPYKIIGWLDTFPSAFDQKLRTTKATLKKQKMLSYWNQNSLKDSSLRKELGLE